MSLLIGWMALMGSGHAQEPAAPANDRASLTPLPTPRSSVSEELIDEVLLVLRGASEDLAEELEQAYAVLMGRSERTPEVEMTPNRGQDDCRGQGYRILAPRLDSVVPLQEGEPRLTVTLQAFPGANSYRVQVRDEEQVLVGELNLDAAPSRSVTAEVPLRHAGIGRWSLTVLPDIGEHAQVRFAAVSTRESLAECSPIAGQAEGLEVCQVLLLVSSKRLWELGQLEVTDPTASALRELALAPSPASRCTPWSRAPATPLREDP